MSETTALLRLAVKDEVSAQMARARKELDLLQQSTNRTSGSVNALSLSFRRLAPQLTAAGLAYTATQKALRGIQDAFTAPIANARSFETAMARVSTVMEGETKESIKALGHEILELSKVIPKSKEELGAGLYQIMQSGIEDATDAMKVLEVSAQAAVGGVTEIDTAAKVLTDTINAYGLSAQDSAKLADIMFVGARMGTAEFEDLAGSMGTVNSTAALLGVSVNEVVAATEAMSLAGIDAQTATTSLNRLLLSVVNPSKEVRDAVAELSKQYKDFSFSAEALKQKGLQQFMKDLQVVVGDNQELMVQLTGDVRAFRAAAVIAGTGAENFAKILDATKESEGALREAFIKNADTVDNLLTVAWNTFIAQITEAGNAHLPEMKDAIREMTLALDENQDQIISAALALSEGLVSGMKVVVDNAPEIIGVLGDIAWVAGKTVSAIGFVSDAVGSVIPGHSFRVMFDDLKRKQGSDSASLSQVDYGPATPSVPTVLRSALSGTSGGVGGGGGGGSGTDKAAKELEKLEDAMKDVGETYRNQRRSIVNDIATLEREHKQKMDQIEESIAKVKDSIEELEASYAKAVKGFDADEIGAVADQIEKVKDLEEDLKDLAQTARGENNSGSISVRTNEKLLAKQEELKKEREALEKYLMENPEMEAKAKAENAKTDFDKDLETLKQRREEEKTDHDRKMKDYEDEMSKLEKKRTLEVDGYTAARAQYELTLTALDAFNTRYTQAMNDISTVTKETVDDMKVYLEELKATIDQIDALTPEDGTTDDKVNERRLGRQADGRASGGFGSGLTWVGERGPELLDLPPGSYVHNNRESQRMSGGVTVTIGAIHASSAADGRKAAREIIQTITRELQRGKLLAA